MSHERVRGGCVGMMSWLALLGSYRIRLAYSSSPLALIALLVGAPGRTEARMQDGVGFPPGTSQQPTNTRNLLRTKALGLELLRSQSSALRGLPRALRRRIGRHFAEMIHLGGAAGSGVTPHRVEAAAQGELGPLEQIFAYSVSAGATLGMAWVAQPSGMGHTLELRSVVDEGTQRPRTGLLATETVDRVALGSGAAHDGGGRSQSPRQSAHATVERTTEQRWRVKPTVSGEASEGFGAVAVQSTGVFAVTEGGFVQTTSPRRDQSNADNVRRQVEAFIAEQLAAGMSNKTQPAAAALRGFIAATNGQAVEVLTVTRPSANLKGIVLRAGGSGPAAKGTSGHTAKGAVFPNALFVAANWGENSVRVPLVGDDAFGRDATWDVLTEPYPAARGDYQLDSNSVVALGQGATGRSIGAAGVRLH